MKGKNHNNPRRNMFFAVTVVSLFPVFFCLFHHGTSSSAACISSAGRRGRTVGIIAFPVHAFDHLSRHCHIGTAGGTLNALPLTPDYGIQ